MDAGSSQEHLTITVKVFGGMRGSLPDGAQQLSLSSGATIADVLRALDERVPELAAKLRDGMAAGYLNTLINGRNVRFLQGDDTPLRGGDTVAFLPPVGGG
jgi:molybdopterin synthase sulfur carrier subunit